MISFAESYRKYTDEIIINLIDVILSKALPRMLRMPERTEQDYFARFRDGEEYLPSRWNKKVKGPKPMPGEGHTKVLQEFYDNDATATIKQAYEMIWNTFNIAITQSGLQKHSVVRCGLTLKKLEKNI